MKTTAKSLLMLLTAVCFSSASAQTTFTTSASINSGDTTFDGQDIVVTNCTLTVNGAHEFNSLTLVGGAILTHSPAPNGETNNRINLTVAGNVMVDAASQILGDGLGFAQSSGPGAGYTGNTSAGGGYGGMGGTANSHGGGLAYGSLTKPADFGSGGGAGAGGGAIALVVGGTLQVNGTISSDGAGNGSGGSIFLQAVTISGGGVIQANGSSGGNNGGGGGRIAIGYQNNSFTGTTTAFGGAGSGQPGGAGTIYLQAQSSALASVLLDNDGQTDSAYTPADLMQGTNLLVTVTNGTQIAIWGGETWTVDQLTVATNSTVECFSTNNSTQVSNQWVGAGGTISVQSLSINSGGIISADGQGYVSGAGPGAGVLGNTVAGGGYGGNGGTVNSGGGGMAYGSFTHPTDLGSGAGRGGGNGGGSVSLIVPGTLQMNGLITAGGVTAGSGGSISIQSGTLNGTGVIQANGGYGNNPTTGNNGGGGGRIALICQTNIFAGTITAFGGTGSDQPGGAGTIYLQAQSSPLASVMLDNNGQVGSAYTPADLMQGTNLLVTVANGTQVAIFGGETWMVDQLTVETNATIECLSINNTGGSAGRGAAIAAQSVTINPGGGVISDGQGYIGEEGPGAGVLGNAPGGGGYGGNGGTSLASGGGNTYGSSNQPVDLGSGGYGSGASGGGAIRMVVTSTLIDNGTISSGGWTANGCGGSGGSIWLIANLFSGDGLVQANGAGGFWNGGGGGRIAIDAQNNSFAGTIVAAGGGSQGGFGGAGTIVFQHGNGVPFILYPIPPQTAYPLTLLKVPVNAGDQDVNATLTYSLVNPPAGMYVNASGLITWTPTQNQSPSTNTVTLVVTSTDPNDTANPQLSATNNFEVIVVPRIQLGSPAFLGSGQFQFQFPAASGYTYDILTSTNLFSWHLESQVQGTNGTVTFTDTNATVPMQFYRIEIISP